MKTGAPKPAGKVQAIISTNGDLTEESVNQQSDSTVVNSWRTMTNIPFSFPFRGADGAVMRALPSHQCGPGSFAGSASYVG